MVKKIGAPYDRVLRELVESVRERFNLVSFVVYGSVARNEAKKRCGHSVGGRGVGGQV